MMEIKPVVFKIGNEEYGVDISIVQGIEKVLPVVPMHNVNRNIKGIINLRGEVIPLYSLRRKFGLPEAAYTDDTKFVIAQEGDLKIAIEVDSVGEIQTIEEKNVFPIPKILRAEDTGYYDKIIDVNQRIVVMIDITKLMSEEEAKKLNEALKDME